MLVCLTREGEAGTGGAELQIPRGEPSGRAGWTGRLGWSLAGLTDHVLSHHTGHLKRKSHCELTRFNKKQTNKQKKEDGSQFPCWEAFFEKGGTNAHEGEERGEGKVLFGTGRVLCLWGPPEGPVQAVQPRGPSELALPRCSGQPEVLRVSVFPFAAAPGCPLVSRAHGRAGPAGKAWLCSRSGAPCREGPEARGSGADALQERGEAPSEETRKSLAGQLVETCPAAAQLQRMTRGSRFVSVSRASLEQIFIQK